MIVKDHLYSDGSGVGAGSWGGLIPSGSMEKGWWICLGGLPYISGSSALAPAMFPTSFHPQKSQQEGDRPVLWENGVD